MLVVPQKLMAILLVVLTTFCRICDKRLSGLRASMVLYFFVCTLSSPLTFRPHPRQLDASDQPKKRDK